MLGVPRVESFPTSRRAFIGGTALWQCSMSSDSRTVDRCSRATGTVSPRIASPEISYIGKDCLQLAVRESVAVRRFAGLHQTLFYLSLFDDEIESRLAEFLGCGSRTTWTEEALASAALSLEPTDVVVIACKQGEI